MSQRISIRTVKAAVLALALMTFMGALALPDTLNVSGQTRPGEIKSTVKQPTTSKKSAALPKRTAVKSAPKAAKSGGEAKPNRQVKNRLEAQKILDYAKNFIVNVRQFSADRIVTVDGGIRPQATVELWFLPAGKVPPPGPITFRVLRWKGGEVIYVTQSISADEVEGKENGDRELGAFLDRLMMRLANYPGAMGYIIAYGGSPNQP